MRLRGVYEVHSDEERLQLLADLVEEGSQDPIIRETAIRILKAYRVPEKDEIGEVKAIFDWVKRNFRYTKDITGRDTYHTARRILELKVFDCDDATIILDSLLASIGYPVGARIITTSPDKGFHHIYSLVKVKGKWIPLDPTNKRFKIGQEPRYYKKRDFQFILGE